MEAITILITDERKHALKKAATPAFDIVICVSESVEEGEFVYSSDPEIIAVLDRERDFLSAEHVCDVAIFSTILGENSLILRLEKIFSRIEKTYEMLYEDDARRDDGESDSSSSLIGSI